MFAGSNSLSHVLTEKRVLEAANDCSPKKARLDLEVEQEKKKDKQEAAKDEEVEKTNIPGTGEDLAQEDKVTDVKDEKKDSGELIEEKKMDDDDLNDNHGELTDEKKEGNDKESEEKKSEDEEDLKEEEEEEKVVKFQAKTSLDQHLRDLISNRPPASLSVQTITDEVNNFHRVLNVPDSHPEQLLAFALKKLSI